MKPFLNGLVVGKFSPLHAGHRHLIDTALAQCDRVMLLSWSVPELPECPAETRLRWLKNAYPQCLIHTLTRANVESLKLTGAAVRSLPPNTAPDTEHRQFVGEYCQNVADFIPDAVFTGEDYGEGFAKELSVFFSTNDGQNIHVKHVFVARDGIISGTAIREHVHQWRDALTPFVYASFVKRVCFLGGESTGKSTMARVMAETYSTRHVAEYGRERWEEQQGKLLYADMLKIAQTQVEWENSAALESREWLFCDTSPLTTLFYSEALFSKADEELVKLANRPYSIVFLCEDDFPFVQDGTRMDDAFRKRQQRWYEEQLTKRRIPFIRLSGTPDERVSESIKALVSLSKRR